LLLLYSYVELMTKHAKEQTLEENRAYGERS